jgi:RNA polymerase-associated protein
MATVANKRSIMILYTGSTDILSHRVRIVLAEKGVTVELINVPAEEKPQSLLEINPYGTVPTLVDRDLVLYDTNIILEYLDERFPHPPLMPVYPVARAKSRLTMYRFDQDLTPLVRKIEHGNPAEAKIARKQLETHLITIAPLFAEMTYFLSEEFSLVDCCLIPLLWRLPYLGIELPGQIKDVSAYASRVFSRPSFKTSLTEAERELRERVT